MEHHFRAFTAIHLWCYEVTELVNCLREGGGSLAAGKLWTSVAATYMMPFKKIKGSAGRQRTEPSFCDSPEHTDGKSAPDYPVFHRVAVAQTDPLEYRVYHV